MNLAISLVVLAAQLALADEPIRSVQGVQIGASTSTVRTAGPDIAKRKQRPGVQILDQDGKIVEETYTDPPANVQISSGAPAQPLLESRVTIRLTKGPLRSFFTEIAQQARIHFILVPGLEHCVVSAYLRNLTVREALQVLLSIKGMTYQQSGRSDTYVIVPRKDIKVCPRLTSTKKAVGSCTAVKGSPISLNCKDGPLSSFAEIAFDQSNGSFYFESGAEDYPITAQLSGASLEQAADKVIQEDALTVKQLAAGKAYFISLKKSEPEK